MRIHTSDVNANASCEVDFLMPADAPAVNKLLVSREANVNDGRVAGDEQSIDIGCDDWVTSHMKMAESSLRPNIAHVHVSKIHKDNDVAVHKESDAEIPKKGNVRCRRIATEH
jgi:hypothetical protein